MRNVLVYLVSVAVMCGILLSFSACGSSKKSDDVKKVTTTTATKAVETSVVYVTKTDKNGNVVTNKNDKASSEESKTKKNKKKGSKTKTTKFTYKIIDGNSNDPAVVDPF